MHSSAQPTRILIRSTLLVGAILLVCTAAFAQPGGRGQRSGQQPGPPKLPDAAQVTKMVNEMSAALSLTDSQTEQVSELHIAHFAAASDLMAKAKGDRETHRKKMGALRTEFESELKAVMRDDQIPDFEAYMKERQPQVKRTGRRK